MAMMDNSPLQLRQPTGIFRSSDRMTVSAQAMQCHGNSSEFRFSAPRHHVHRCPAVFTSRHPTNRSLRLPGSVNKVHTAPFCTSNRSFPLAQFWRDGIENCQSVNAQFSVEHPPISSNVPGLMTSISDQ
jgi:hypothetical protein